MRSSVALMIVALVLFGAGLGAVTKFWTGNQNSTWVVGANWSPVGTPTASDDVIIPSTSNNPAMIDSGDVEILSLGLSDDLTILDGMNLEVTNNLSIGSAAELIAVGSSIDISVGGSWTNNGTFTGTGSRVIFNKTTTSAIQGGVQTDFWDLSVQKQSSVSFATNVSTTISVKNDLSIGGGFLVVNPIVSGPELVVTGSVNIGTGATLSLSNQIANEASIGGTWTNDGTFNAGISTVTLDGTMESTTISGTSQSTFNNLVIAKTDTTDRVFNSGVQLSVGGNLTIVKGVLEVTSVGSVDLDVGVDLIIDTLGTLDASGSNVDIVIGDDWSNNGAFDAGTSSEVVMDGLLGTATMSGTSSRVLHDLTIDSSSIVLTTGSVSTVVNGTLDIVSGELDLNTSASPDLFVGLDVVIGNTGALDLSNFADIQVGRDWVNNGTFQPGSAGFVTFVGPLPTDISGSAPTSFTRLYFDKDLPSTQITHSVEIRATDRFRIVSGTLLLSDVGASDLTLVGPADLSILSDGTVNANQSGIEISIERGFFNFSGDFVPGTSTVTFTGSEISNIGNGGSAVETDFYNVVVAKDTSSNRVRNNGIPVNVLGDLHVVTGTFEVNDVATPELIVDGSITVETDGVINAATSSGFINILVGENWTMNGGSFLTISSNEVTFDGSLNSVIGGASVTTFRNVRVDKSSSGLTVSNGDTTIDVLNDLSVDQGTLAIIDAASVTNELDVVGQLSIAPGATMTVGGDANCVLNTASSVAIDGSFVSTPGASNRSMISGTYPSITFGPTSAVTLDGITFDGTGVGPYKLDILSGASLNQFDNVAFENVASSVAVMRIATTSLPSSFQGFFVDGNSPANIDANSLSSASSVDVFPSSTGGGNLFGEVLDLDDNNVLTWRVLWTGATSQDWFDAGNWNTLVVPDSQTAVSIPDVSGASGNFPEIDIANGTQAFSGDLTIDANASLAVVGAPTLTVAGNWKNNGVFDGGGGTVEFTGSSNAIMDGLEDTPFWNVKVTKSTGFRIESLDTPWVILNNLDVLTGVFRVDFVFSETHASARDVNIGAAGTIDRFSTTNAHLEVLGSFTNNGVFELEDLFFRGNGTQTYFSSTLIPLSLMRIEGTGPLLFEIEAGSTNIDVYTFRIDTPHLVQVSGTFTSSNAVLIGSNSLVELMPGFHLSGTLVVVVVGNGSILKSTAGDIGSLRPTLDLGGDTLVVDGTIDVDGLIVQNIGLQRGVDFRGTSVVTRFDNVSIDGIDSAVAGVYVNATSLPSMFDNFEITLGSGSATTNVSAPIAGPPFTINASSSGGGDFFGAQYESDPNNIVNWSGGPEVQVYEDNQFGLEIMNGDLPVGQRVFGVQHVDDGATDPAVVVYVENTGTSDLALGLPTGISGDSGEFVVDTSGFSTSIAPGQGTTFTIAFDPNVNGPLQATIGFSHSGINTTSPFEFEVSGVGFDEAVTEEYVPVRENGSPQEPVRNATMGANSVYLHNGEFRYDLPLISLPGRMLPMSVSLTYRSQLDFEGPLGYGWTSSSMRRITYDDVSDEVVYFTGSGRIDTFTLQAGGTAGVGPYVKAGYFVEIVRDDNSTPADFTDDEFQILGAHGSVTTFSPTIEDQNGSQIFRETSMKDRYDNEVTCTYDLRGHLTEMRGDLYSAANPDRYRLVFTYDGNDRLEKITDYADYSSEIGDIGGPAGNREWEFVYDGSGDLREVKLPETSRYFSESQGATYRTRVAFNYDGSHNMLEAFDARENNQTTPIAWLQNFYDGSDRVDMQDLGRTSLGDTTHREFIVYTSSTNVDCINQLNYRTEYVLNADGTASAVRFYTAEWDPGDLSSPSAPKIRASDPDFYETLFVYNGQLQLENVTYPLGNSMSYAYDSGNVSQRSKGNLLRVLATPDAARSGSLPLEQLYGLLTTMTYKDAANFNLVETVVNPRAYSVPQNFDIVNDPDPTPNDATKFTTTFTYFADGSLEKVTSPAVDSTISPNTLNNGQVIETDYTYNSFGQLLTTTDQAGVVTRYGYGATGFVKDYVVEIAVGDQTGNPLSTFLDYNSVGQVVSVTDPKGFTYPTFVNQLDQTIRSETPSVTFHGNVNYFTEYEYDLNGNLERLKVSNFNKNGVLQNPSTIDSTYQYNALDLATSITEPITTSQSRTMSYVYDTLYRMTESIMPEGNRSGAEYDELNRSIKSFYGYDGTTVTQPASLITSEVFFDLNSNAERALDGRGNDSHFLFDGYDRVIEVQDRLSSNPNKSIFEYNRANQVTVSTRIGKKQALSSGSYVIENDKTLAQSKTFYDNLGRPYMSHVLSEKVNETALSYPNLEINKGNDILSGFSVSRIKFRINGQVEETRDDLEYAHRYSYDSYNRVQLIQDDRDGPGGNNDFDFYVYDDNSNVLNVIANLVDDRDESVTQLTTTYTYDSINRLVQDDSPVLSGTGSSLTRAYRYDSRSNMVETFDRKGVQRTYVYDLLDRSTRSTTEDVDIWDVDPNTGLTTKTPTDIIGITEYDKNSNVTAVIDPNGNKTQFKYDLAQRWLQTTQPDGIDDGVPGGHMKSAGTDHTLTSVPGTPFFTQPLAYDGNSNLLNLKDHNGTVITNTYDENDNLSSQLSNTAGTAPQFNIVGELGLGYDYDGLYRSISGVTIDSSFAELTRTETAYNSLSLPQQQRQQVTLSSPYSGAVLSRDIKNAYDESGRRWQRTNPSDKTRSRWTFDRKHRPKTMELCVSGGAQQVEPVQYTTPLPAGSLGTGGTLGGGGGTGGTGGGTTASGRIQAQPINGWNCKGTVTDYDYYGGGLMHSRHTNTMLDDPSRKVISDFNRDELLRVNGVRHVRDDDGNELPSAGDTLLGAFAYDYDANSMMNYEARWYQNDGGGFATDPEEVDYYVHDDRNQLVKATYNILNFAGASQADLDNNNVIHTDRQVFGRRRVPTRTQVAWYRHLDGLTSNSNPDNSTTPSQWTDYQTSDDPNADPDSPAAPGEGSRHTYDCWGSICYLCWDYNKNLTCDGTRDFEYNYLNQLRTVTRRSDNETIAEYREDAYSRRVMAETNWELGRRVYFDTRFELDVNLDEDFDPFVAPPTPMSAYSGYITSERHESANGVNDDSVGLDEASWGSHVNRLGANDDHYIDSFFFVPSTGLSDVYYGYVSYNDDVAVHVWDDRFELGTRDRSSIYQTHFTAVAGNLYSLGIKITNNQIRVYADDNTGSGSSLLMSHNPGTDLRDANSTLIFASKGIKDGAGTIFQGLSLFESLSYVKAYNHTNEIVPANGAPRVRVTFFDGPVPVTNMEVKPGSSPTAFFNQPESDYLDAQNTRARINAGNGSSALNGRLFLPDGKRTTALVISDGNFPVAGGGTDDTVGVVLVGKTDAQGTLSWHDPGAITFIDPTPGCDDTEKGGYCAPWYPDTNFANGPGVETDDTPTQFGGFMASSGGISSLSNAAGFSSGLNFALADGGGCACRGASANLATMTVAYQDNATGLKGTFSGGLLNDTQTDVLFGDDDNDIIDEIARCWDFWTGDSPASKAGRSVIKEAAKAAGAEGAADAIDVLEGVTSGVDVVTGDADVDDIVDIAEAGKVIEEALTWDNVLDALQTALTVAGIVVPGIGDIADGINAAISLARGDTIGALLDALAAIPVLGVTAGIARQAIRGLDNAGDIGRVLKKHLVDMIGALKGSCDALSRQARELLENVQKWIDDNLDVLKKNPQLATPDGVVIRNVDDAASGAKGANVGSAANAGADAAKVTSPNQLQKQVERGKAPKTVDGVHKGKIPGEKDHVHFKDGSALNKDGTWKHGERDLTNKEKEWLRENGWAVPE